MTNFNSKKWLFAVGFTTMTTLFSTQPKAQTTIDNTAELQAAFNNGGDYVLSGDIVLDADITVNDDRTTNLSISGGPQKYTIDGNGHAGLYLYSYRDGQGSISNMTLKNFAFGALHGTNRYNNVGDNVSFIDNRNSGSGVYGAAGDFNHIGNNAYFYNNAVYATYSAYGGAVYGNYFASTVGSNVVFRQNSLHLESGAGYWAWAQGGAFYSGEATLDGTVFDGNYILVTDSPGGLAQGGALYISESAEDFYINNSRFTDNYITISNSEGLIAQGGAVFAYVHVEDMMAGDRSTRLHISADGGETLFSGNYVEVDGVKKSNAIYMGQKGTKQDWMPDPKNTTLIFKTTRNGKILMDDGIAGLTYDIVIEGDGSGGIFFNNSIEGADSITVTGSTVNLGQYINADMPELNGRGNFDMVTDVKLTNSILNLHNNYYDRINLKNYRSEGDSFLNVNIGYHNGAWDADKMTVAAISSAKPKLSFMPSPTK